MNSKNTPYSIQFTKLNSQVATRIIIIELIKQTLENALQFEQIRLEKTDFSYSTILC